MKHSNLIPNSFIANNTYDESVVNYDPSKALLDCNPHRVSRKWRLVKKFEREMACFDEARFLSDNYDEEVLEIVNALKDAEQPFAQYLAQLSLQTGMQGLQISPSTDDVNEPEITQHDFHQNMAVIMDIAFAILSEKRFLLYEEYNEQTSPVNIIQNSQTLSAFTDPGLWSTPEKRYMAYGVSSLRRYLTFGCFRNYELGMQAMKDVYLASISLGCRVFVFIFSELRNLMEQSQDLDLRWVNAMVLDDAIAWCNKVA